MMHRFGSSLGVAILLLSSSSSQAALKNPDKGWAPPRQAVTSVRVRILKSVASVSVRGFDLRIFKQDPGKQAERRLAAAGRQLSEWVFECSKGSVRARPVRLSGKPAASHEEPEGFAHAGVLSVQSPAGFLSMQNRPYRETLHIRSGKKGCEVVNELGMEKYLDGLVNSEFSSRWSEEAVAAQVIAARTYALHQLQRARASGAFFDLESTISDQAYDGPLKEDWRASRVVERTRGVVLTTGPKATPKPLKAFYHSTCGGKTQLPERVWGKPFPGFSKTVRCSWCGASPAFRWSAELTSSELRALIREGAERYRQSRKWPRDWPANSEDLLKRGVLQGIAPQGVDPSGRILKLSLRWSLGGKSYDLPVTVPTFRNWLGTTRLKSAAFSVRSLTAPKSGARWSFEGAGYGHGVGMCQYGAKGMAEKGHSHQRILGFYYPDAKLRKLW